MYSPTIFSLMEGENFFQMHYINLGGGGWCRVLLYNNVHNYKYILSEDCMAGGRAIFCCAGLTTSVSFCFDFI
jgi:hypothetical protein